MKITTHQLREMIRSSILRESDDDYDDIQDMMRTYHDLSLIHI